MQKNIATLKRRSIRDGSSIVRPSLLEALSDLEDRGSLYRSLVTAFQTDQSKLGWISALAIGSLRYRRAIVHLIEYITTYSIEAHSSGLEDPESVVSAGRVYKARIAYEACLSLGMMDDRRSHSALVKFCDKFYPLVIRAAAMEGLGFETSQCCVDSIYPFLDSTAPSSIVLSALWSILMHLREINLEVAMAQCMRLFEYGDPYVIMMLLDVCESAVERGWYDPIAEAKITILTLGNPPFDQLDVVESAANVQHKIREAAMQNK